MTYLLVLDNIFICLRYVWTMDQFRNDVALWVKKLRGRYDAIFIELQNVIKISWSKFVYIGNGELRPTNQNSFNHIWIDRNLKMGDEDDGFSPYKCVRLFPSENEWPWSLSEGDVPEASWKDRTQHHVHKYSVILETDTP